MNKLLITVLFAFSMNALAETAQLGENQNPPSKTTAGGCCPGLCGQRIRRSLGTYL